MMRGGGKGGGLPSGSGFIPSYNSSAEGRGARGYGVKEEPCVRKGRKEKWNRLIVRCLVSRSHSRPTEDYPRENERGIQSVPIPVSVRRRGGKRVT